MKIILIVKPIGSFRLKQIRKILEATFDDKKDTDLLNIRDEILSDINQFLYLMTFDK